MSTSVFPLPKWTVISGSSLYKNLFLAKKNPICAGIHKIFTVTSHLYNWYKQKYKKYKASTVWLFTYSARDSTSSLCMHFSTAKSTVTCGKSHGGTGEIATVGAIISFESHVLHPCTLCSIQTPNLFFFYCVFPAWFQDCMSNIFPFMACQIYPIFFRSNISGISLSSTCRLTTGDDQHLYPVQTLELSSWG